MKHWKQWVPLIVIIVVAYWQFFAKGKIPMPGDLMTGAYYPWLDYKWGFSTGVAVKNPVISDVFSQFFPWKYFIVEQFQNGILPLWNQYSFSGISLLASYSSAAFLPFNILLFLPKYMGWGWFISGQTFTALLGMYLFLGKYSKHSLARIGGATVFAFSGLMTTWTEFGTGVWAAAMLPWILFALDRYIDTQKTKYVLLFSVSLSCLYLAGHTQLDIYGTVLIGAYALFLFWRKEASALNIIQIALASILAIGLSTIELLPAFSQMSSSVRAAEAYSKTFNYGLTPFYDLIMVYVADFFGNPTTYNYWGNISYHECASFLGTLTVPLIAPLLWQMRGNKLKTGFWVVVFVVSVFLAIDSPVTQLIYSQPWPLITYSSASRILFISSLSAGILVAFGLEELLKGNAMYRKKVLFASLGLIGSIFLALLLLKINHVTPINVKVSLRNALLPIGFLTMSLILLKIKPIPAKVVVFLFVLIISVDMIRYFQKYNPFVETKLVFPSTPITEFLTHEPGLFRIGRLNQEVMTPNTWMPYHLSSVEGYDPLSFENYSRFFNRVNGNSYFDSVNRYTQIFRPDFTFLGSLNVRYYLDVLDTHRPLAASNHLEEVFRDKSVVIYRDNKSLERAYFVSTVIEAGNTKEMAAILDKSDFNPKNTALVITDKVFPTLTLGQVNISKYTDNNVFVETNNEGTGFLVLADTYDPGWNAYIDNNRTDIYEVNGALRGIVVPQGKHHILFKYWPSSVEWGIKISGASFAILLGYGAYALTKHTLRRRQDSNL